MDNAIVGATGTVCFLMAQVSTNWIESITPLGIVGIVVYYFLWKFDRKLDVVEDQTRDIKNNVDEIRDKLERGKEE